MEDLRERIFNQVADHIVRAVILTEDEGIIAGTGAVKEENPDFIKTGDAAIVKVVPTRPMVIESAKKIPQLGRFAIRDMGQTVAAGVCLEVEEAK